MPTRQPKKQEEPKRLIKVSDDYNKEYRTPNDYKELKLKTDNIAVSYTNAIKSIVFKQYEDEALNFTIYQKAQALKSSVSQLVNGPNTITEQTYNLDYDKEQYKTLKYINKPTLEEIKANKYICDSCTDDKKLTSTLNTFFKVSKAKIDKNDLTTVLKYHRLILLDMLIYRNEKNHSPYTAWADIKYMARLSKICLGPDNELTRKLSRFSDDYDKAINRATEAENIKSIHESKAFVPYKKLLEMIDELEQRYKEELNRDRPYKETVYKLHLYYLILMSYTLTPPVRKDLSEMIFTDNEQAAISDKNNDYVYIPDDKNELVKFIFHNNNKRQPYVSYPVGFPDDKENQNEQAKRLSDFIRYSYNQYPRKYYITLITDKHTPAGSQNLGRYLKKMFNNQPLNVDQLRSAYVTHLYEINAPLKVLQNAAFKMRNSLRSQLFSYRKVIQEENLKKYDENRKEVKQINKEAKEEAEEEAKKDIVINVKVRKDPAQLNREHQIKHRLKDPETYYKIRQEYRRKNKEKLRINRILKKYNHPDAKPPTKKIEEKYYLYKDGNEWKTHFGNRFF